MRAGPTDPAVEGVQGGQGEVDRRGLGLALGDQVGAVVPDGVVAGVAVGERVALATAGDRVELGEPSEVAADPAGVRTAGRRRQRQGLQVAAVGLVPVGEVLVEASDIGADSCCPDRHPTRLLLSEVLLGR